MEVVFHPPHNQAPAGVPARHVMGVRHWVARADGVWASLWHGAQSWAEES